MAPKSLKLRNKRSLEYGADGIPAVFGILNVTPDSFSDGGRFPDPDHAVRGALAMLDAGACGIDVGAESTRPGAEEVPVPVEIERLVPVIRALKEARGNAVISVDTRKAAVAAAALEAGADDVLSEDDAFTVYTSVQNFSQVRKFLEDKGLSFFEASLEMIPQSKISFTGEAAEKFQKLVDALEDLDDVQDVYHNVDLPEEEEE